jgi:hypothetical protein
MCCEPAASGRRCLKNTALPARCMSISSAGRGKAFSSGSGRPVWSNTTRWRASPGAGRAWTGRRVRRRWRWNVWGPTRRIGKKKRRKRSLLVDARGIPLSLVASGANVHDSSLLRATLSAIVHPRLARRQRRMETLCADAARMASRLHRYQLNVKTRRQEVGEKQHHPRSSRATMGGRTHALLVQPFPQLLVSFEKIEASYTALLSLAAALICWRQIIPIYG